MKTSMHFGGLVATLVGLVSSTGCYTFCDVDNPCSTGQTCNLERKVCEDSETGNAPLPTDAGSPTQLGSDAGTPNVDDGTPGADAGTPNVDAGTPNVDAGMPNVDAGTSNVDAGTNGADAGTPNIDAGRNDADAGTPGADAGPEITDAGPPDTTPPQIQVTGYDTLTNDPNQNFTITCEDTSPTCVLTCRLNNEAPTDCSNPDYSPTASEGENTLVVTGEDAAHNLTTLPDIVWTLDTVAPEIVSIAGPADVSILDTQRFEFSCSDTLPCAFTCLVDSTPSSPCESGDSFGPFSDGLHSVIVNAFDAAGNKSLDLLFNWKVDTTPPTVSFNSFQANINSSNQEVYFTCNDNSTPCTFNCALNNGASFECTTGYGGANLVDGSYALVVTPTDNAGNVGASATASWNVDTLPPSATFVSAPTDPTYEDIAVFDLQCDTGDCIVDLCTLGNLTLSTCRIGTFQFHVENAGPQVLTVHLKDAAGNTGNVTYSWNMDCPKCMQPCRAPPNAIVVDDLDLNGTKSGKCSLQQAIATVDTQIQNGTCAPGTAVIKVPNGFYNGSSELMIPTTRTVEIIGEGGDATFLSSSTSRLFNVPDGANLILRMIQLTGYATQAPNDTGGAVKVSGAGGFTADRVVFQNSNGGSTGGALDVGSGGTATLIRCEFRECRAASGGAIWVQPGSTVTISYSLFESNHADGLTDPNGRGGAIFTQGALKIFQSTFINNTAGITGAGIFIKANAPQLKGNVFFNNIADTDNLAHSSDVAIAPLSPTGIIISYGANVATSMTTSNQADVDGNLIDPYKSTSSYPNPNSLQSIEIAVAGPFLQNRNIGCDDISGSPLTCDAAGVPYLGPNGTASDCASGYVRYLP